MKKEFVVVRIDASPDGAPYVVVSLSSSKDLNEKNNLTSPSLGTNVMGFSNMDDMMKGLNKMISGGMGGMPGMGGGLTSLKLDMHEYKDLGVAVGDKVYLEMTKIEGLGV